MTGIKTKPGEYDLQKFLDSLDDARRQQSEILMAMMRDVTDKEPVLWGTSIIGFDPFHYRSRSGSEGIWPRIGFSPRKGKIALYITMEAEKYLAQVEVLGGKNSIGKGCIYLAKFEQVDKDRLLALIQQAYKEGFTEHLA